MPYQITSFLKLIITLIFLSMSAEATSVPLSHNTLFSGKVSRSPTSTTITLSSAPVLDVNTSKGTNGPLTGMIKNPIGIGTNPAKTAEYMQMGKSMAESRIRISIPLIDYGYIGTLNNVCIKLRGKKNEKYATTKLGKRSHCIGTVTIENYTRFELRGTYSGGLTNLEFEPKYPKINSQVNNGFATGTPINFPPIAGSIKGSFYILDPWRHDSRFGFDEDSYIDAAESDLKGMAAEFGIDVEGMFGKARSNKGRNGSGSSSVRDVKACDCSCNYVTSATPVCKVQCEKVFTACTAEPYEPPEESVLTHNDASSLPAKYNLPKVKGAKLQGIDQEFVDTLENGEVEKPDNLRAKFISRLQKNHPGEANAPIRDMMIKGFDSMPDDKAKMVMFKSIE